MVIGCVYTRWLTAPCSCALPDSLAIFPNWPRGTPKPAELLRITSLLPVNVEAVPRFTATVLVPVVGARGGT